jgi:hypothetical protein
MMLAVSYVETGRAQEARVEAAEVMRISPNLVYKEITNDAAVNQHMLADLQKAGLK